MNVIRRFMQRASKPHYLFRPGQVLRRLAWTLKGPSTERFVTLPLPWGLSLRCRPNEAIGGAVARIGVFELVVTEALWRLSDPGELAIDAGANIGYMTSVLAMRLGPLGRVISFEPHPEVFAELKANVDAWSRAPGVATIDARPLGLSSAPGRAQLSVGPDFAANRGLGTLTRSAAGSGEEMQWPVELTTLDQVLGADVRVGTMKVDVEGHERSLLEGARRALATRRIRDIVFEAHDGYPSPVTEFLEQYGYRIYALVPTLLRPRTVDPARGVEDLWPPWESPNCLATLEPERAVTRLRGLGWRTLRA